MKGRKDAGRLEALPLRPLSEGSGKAATALQAFTAQTAPTPTAEEAAWHRVRMAMAVSDPETWQAPRRWPLVAGLSFAAGAAAAAAVLLLTIGREPSSLKVEERARPASQVDRYARQATHPGNADRPRMIIPTARPARLPTGALSISGEAVAHVPAGTRADVSLEAGDTRVALEKGPITFEVKPRPSGRRFRVYAGGYQFIVVGTAFEVIRAPHTIELRVSEGRVAVWSSERRLAIVSAGERWTGKDVAEGAPPPVSVSRSVAAVDVPPAQGLAPRDSGERGRVGGAHLAGEDRPVTPTLAPAGAGDSEVPSTAPPPAPVVVSRAVSRAETLAACERLSDESRHHQAAFCFLGIADGHDLTSETALYEAARLQSGRLDDAAAALNTIELYRRRFPRGALRAEVDLTLIELLPRLKRYREALAESAMLLELNPDHERKAELRVLRGNIHREAFDDCGKAVQEYEAARLDPSLAGDRAGFFHAVCLEAIGRRVEAAQAYRRYLARPDARRANEARIRLADMAP